MPRSNETDAYSPPEIAARIEASGVAKANLPVLQTLTLGALAGAYISFGALFFILVTTDSGLGVGVERLTGGVAFSLGLILVIVAGAELFTGNNLIVIAWADRKVGSLSLLRNWGLVYAANFVGALATAVLVGLSGVLDIGAGAVGDKAVAIVEAKVSLSFSEAFFRGILCNALVCLAVWLAMAARDVAGKILAIIFPISAFVAVGFEHSVANMFFFPLGMIAAPDASAAGFTIGAFAANLVPVTLGNIVGGSVFVALIYYVIYVRGAGPGGAGAA